MPEILAAYANTPAEQLENPRINVRVAGRIMAIRLMGKAGFAHLQQGGARLQIYVKKDAVGDQGFELYKLLDLGDHIGVERIPFPHPHRRAHCPRRRDHVPLEGPASSPRKMAWADRRRAALSPALRRSRHESRGPRGLPQAQQAGAVVSPISRRPRLHRSRDSDDAAYRRGGGCPSVQDAPQHTRHGSLPADRARALPEAAGGGRPRPRLRDQPQLPQRGISAGAGIPSSPCSSSTRPTPTIATSWT